MFLFTCNGIAKLNQLTKKRFAVLIYQASAQTASPCASLRTNQLALRKLLVCTKSVGRNVFRGEVRPSFVHVCTSVYARVFTYTYSMSKRVWTPQNTPLAMPLVCTQCEAFFIYIIKEIHLMISVHTNSVTMAIKAAPYLLHFQRYRAGLNL